MRCSPRLTLRLGFERKFMLQGSVQPARGQSSHDFEARANMCIEWNLHVHVRFLKLRQSLVQEAERANLN